MTQLPKFAIVPIILMLTMQACNSNDDSSSNTNSETVLDDTGSYRVLSSTSLESDGASGADTYDLIESVLGGGSIEAPDLYGEDNHEGETHIYEDEDNQVGNHFVFVIHRDEDKDRDVLENDDRQRNEIKVFGNSDDHLKGFLDTTFEYSWKFRIGDDFAVTSKFTHLFQLKAVGEGLTSSPILTITANTKSGVSGLEIRHVAYNSDQSDTENNTLTHTSYEAIDWATQIQGQWLEVFVRANYSENGSLTLTLTPLGEQTPLISIYESDIEMWRAGGDNSSSNFVRPKWGIYRSIVYIDELNEEDHVDFADFLIEEVELIETSE